MSLNETNIGYIVPPKENIVWNKTISYCGEEETIV